MALTLTLTQNIMTFNKCSIAGQSYGDVLDDTGEQLGLAEVRGAGGGAGVGGLRLRSKLTPRLFQLSFSDLARLMVSLVPRTCAHPALKPSHPSPGTLTS